MRQFYLVNEDGQRYELINDFSKAFLWQPSGLGFQIDREYRESDGFFFEMRKEFGQTAKAGTLVFFGSDPYGEYKTFVDFITQADELKLAYCPKNDWYYVDVDIEVLEKSELSDDGTLRCMISMLPKTPFYLPYEINIDIDGDPGASKQYDYKYDYAYADSAVAGEIEFSLDAQMNSAFEMIIPGTISAPVMTFSIDGVNIGKVDLSSIAVQNGEYVRYSSIPTSAGIYLYSSGTETDITAQIGLSASLPTFFLLPPNKTIKAKLTASSLTGTSAELKVYEYFYSV